MFAVNVPCVKDSTGFFYSTTYGGEVLLEFHHIFLSFSIGKPEILSNLDRLLLFLIHSVSNDKKMLEKQRLVLMNLVNLLEKGSFFFNRKA